MTRVTMRASKSSSSIFPVMALATLVGMFTIPAAFLDRAHSIPHYQEQVLCPHSTGVCQDQPHTTLYCTQHAHSSDFQPAKTAEQDVELAE